MADPNPYAPPSEDSAAHFPDHQPPAAGGPGWCILWGAIVAVVGSFPLAAAVALLFRFPVPFAGYASGPRAMIPAMIGAVFYGLAGGVIVQTVFGGASGIFAYRLGRGDAARTRRLCLSLGLLAALPGLVLLAILDWIIGPW